METQQIEQQVVNVWRMVLGNSSLDADANFVALGGTSIAALRIISRLRKIFDDNDIPLRALFDNPTPRALVQFMRTKGAQ